MTTGTSKNNPLICDPEEGVCGIPGLDSALQIAVQQTEKPVRVIYFTDPICSSCWAIEPALRKLKLAYHDYLEVVYYMGGLLPDWSYNSGGISKPADVASHWDEVSIRYDMPIDGDVWLEDPLASSYPPSIAFKAAQLQDEEKAILFLREMREMVFLQKKNIAKWEHLAAVLKLYPQAAKPGYDKSWEALFLKYKSLTAKEYSELSDTPRAESEAVLDGLSDKGILKKLTTKNGALWISGS